MRSRWLVVVACALLAVTACSDDEPAAVPVSLSASVDPCSGAVAEGELPEDCRAVSPTASAPAEGSAFYDAVTVEELPDQLAGVGNDVDPSRTTATFTVTVQAGRRLGSQSVCEGTTRLVLETEPASGAAGELDCGADGQPLELGLEEETPVSAPTTYTVTVTAPAPSRWYTAVYETAAAP